MLTAISTTIAMQDNSEDLAQSQREAFSRLAREVAPTLIRIARRLCPHDEDTAQDLVQNTLVQGYEKLHSGDLVIGYGTQKWLIRALTNEFLQRLRKDKRITWSNEAADVTPTNFPSADQQHLTQETESVIEFALQKLNPEHRACLVLVDLHDYNYQDAADILEIPVGTVRSRLSRARLKMAEIVTDLKQKGQL